MTLFRQLMLLILVLFSFSFAGSLYVTFKNSRDYYQEQLEITAQDTATSLGLSLSTHTDDKAVMLSMVNAIFDRGYFTEIAILSVDGKTLISRKQKPNYQSIPKWFIQLVGFSATTKSALIMSGWMQKGKLIVVSDPSLAYIDLWRTTRGLCLWFFGLTILSLLIAYISTKILFRPLIRVAEQARAICSNVFQIESKLPKTRELRMVTDAMNRTVTKLKSVFKAQAEQINKLRERTYLDTLTQMGNRSFFELKLRHLLSSEEDFQKGHLLFLDIVGLKEYNQRAGFQKGDELVLKVCEHLKLALQTENVFFSARIAGATFAFTLIGHDHDEINRFCEHLLAKIKTSLEQIDFDISASLGVSDYFFSEDRSALLSNVDNALTKARHTGPFNYYVFNEKSSVKTLCTDEWRDILQKALQHNRFEFYSQDIINNDNDIYHQELFTKLYINEKKCLSAGDFIPMAEKLGLTAELDFHVLKTLTSTKEHTVHYSINLSSSLLLNEAKRQTLLHILKGFETPRNLDFELPEHLIMKDIDAAQDFIDSLHTLGYRKGLDRVGATLSPLFYLSRLKCQFLKMDGSLTRDISDSKDKQFFIRHLKNAADTLDITLIATNIESEKEWVTLQELGVVWGQGRFLKGVKKIL